MNVVLIFLQAVLRKTNVLPATSPSCYHDVIIKGFSRTGVDYNEGERLINEHYGSFLVRMIV